MRMLARCVVAAGFVALLGAGIAANAESSAAIGTDTGTGTDTGKREPEQQISKLRSQNHRLLPLPVKSVRHPQNPLPHTVERPTLEIVLDARDAPAQPAYRRRELRCFDSQARAISATWLSSSRFRVKSHRALPPGSSQYICTLPAANGWMYWYSHTWERAKNPP
jgi:hypothetical protein